MSIIGNPILTGGLTPKLIEKEIDGSGLYIAAVEGADGFSRVRVTAGGGGQTYGFVHVIFDKGYVVTATQGSTSISSDTSGRYVFALPFDGTWVFTSSHPNGAGKSKSISLTEYGTVQDLACLYGSLLANSLDVPVCEALPEDYVDGALTWGRGENPAIVTIPSGVSGATPYIDADGALTFLCKSKAGVKIYLDRGVTGGTFTAYTVIRGDELGSFGRLITAGQSGGRNSFGVMGYPTSIWTYAASSTTLSSASVNPQDRFIVCALRYDSDYNTETYGSANDVSYNALNPVYDIDRYITLGMTDPNREESRDIHVKFFAVLDVAEPIATVQANVAHLMSYFGIS